VNGAFCAELIFEALDGLALSPSVEHASEKEGVAACLDELIDAAMCIRREQVGERLMNGTKTFWRPVNFSTEFRMRNRRGCRLRVYI